MSYWARRWAGLPECLADVRRFVRTALGDVPGADDVVLIASELAGNAIRHSASGQPGGSFTLHLATFSDCWHLRVDDQGSAKSPKHGQPEETDEVGRGLPVVDALARAWGVLGDATSWSVWADIQFPVVEAAEIHEGDVVLVREEPALSVVVQPPHQAASCLPENVPDLDICCVPVALVRTLTPHGSGGGLRWEKAADLRVVTDRPPA